MDDPNIPLSPSGVGLEIWASPFVLKDGLFYVVVQNGWLHARCPLEQLASLVRSRPTTRRGADRLRRDHRDQTAHFFEAQLLHYGLPTTRNKNTAKNRLRDAIRGEQLAVPTHLRQIHLQLEFAAQEIQQAHDIAEAEAEAAAEAELEVEEIYLPQWESATGGQTFQDAEDGQQALSHTEILLRQMQGRLRSSVSEATFDGSSPPSRKRKRGPDDDSEDTVEDLAGDIGIRQNVKPIPRLGNQAITKRRRKMTRVEELKADHRSFQQPRHRRQGIFSGYSNKITDYDVNHDVPMPFHTRPTTPTTPSTSKSRKRRAPDEVLEEDHGTKKRCSGTG